MWKSGQYFSITMVSNNHNQVVQVIQMWARAMHNISEFDRQRQSTFAFLKFQQCSMTRTHSYDILRLCNVVCISTSPVSFILYFCSAGVFCDNGNIHVDWFMFHLVWTWEGPTVSLALLHCSFSYFPWLCGIPHSQSHVLSIIWRSIHGLIFFPSLCYWSF